MGLVILFYVQAVCLGRLARVCVLPCDDCPARLTGARARPTSRPPSGGELLRGLAVVPGGWGRSNEGSGSQYSRWAPNIAVARRIWLPGASIMEDYYVPRAHVCGAVLGLSVPKCPGN